MRTQLGQNPIRAEQEDAAVPVPVTLGEQLLRDLAFRLFEEALGAAYPIRSGQRCSGMDVAVAGLRPGGRDAEGQELARPGDRQRLLDRPMQGRGLAHQMIRRAHPKHGIRGEALAGVERRERDRSRGIAPARLEQAVRPELRGDLGQLAADQEIVRAGADGDEVLGGGAGEHASRGLAQQGLAADQRRERFRQGGTADRPQAGACTAQENHWHEWRCAGHSHTSVAKLHKLLRRAGPVQSGFAPQMG